MVELQRSEVPQMDKSNEVHHIPCAGSFRADGAGGGLLGGDPSREHPSERVALKRQPWRKDIKGISLATGG